LMRVIAVGKRLPEAVIDHGVAVQLIGGTHQIALVFIAPHSRRVAFGNTSNLVTR
jgi:hypothetical protein